MDSNNPYRMSEEELRCCLDELLKCDPLENPVNHKQDRPKTTTEFFLAKAPTWLEVVEKYIDYIVKPKKAAKLKK